ncbi:MAG: NUDIX domain-containing protein [Patescibacteria group bacterium]|nr:NUDIX domain-containing protein [Patescibacteria group bacterium]
MEKEPLQQIRVGAGVIVIKDGKTLLAKRKKKALGDGQWGSAGGHVEAGETPAQAAIRETREELGIEVGNLKFLTCLDEQWKNGKQYVDIIFLADILSGDPRPMEPDKVEAVGWFSLDDLPEPLFAPVRLALRNIKQGQHYDEYKE